jgi:hypothetical protein
MTKILNFQFFKIENLIDWKIVNFNQIQKKTLQKIKIHKWNQETISRL